MFTRRAAAVALALCLLGCSSLKRFAYEGFNRDEWQKPDEVVASLGIESGDQVADIGAGSGYFTFRLAEAVGPEGRVYAVDVDEDMIEYLQERVSEENAANVEVVSGEFADPLLPDAQIDLVFSANTYHHIQERPVYFRDLQKDLRAGGRVAILELNDSSWFPRTFGHNTPKEDIVREMGEAGYRVADDFEFLERQSFVIFSPGSE